MFTTVTVFGVRVEGLSSTVGVIGVRSKNFVWNVGFSCVLLELTAAAGGSSAISVKALIGDVGVCSVAGESFFMAGRVSAVATKIVHLSARVVFE